jgi:hypothetical protein
MAEEIFLFFASVAVVFSACVVILYAVDVADHKRRQKRLDEWWADRGE